MSKKATLDYKFIAGREYYVTVVNQSDIKLKLVFTGTDSILHSFNRSFPFVDERGVLRKTVSIPDSCITSAIETNREVR